MSPETQRAYDILSAVQQQRDHALTAMTVAHADILALRRELAAARAEVDALRAELEQTTKATAVPSNDAAPVT